MAELQPERRMVSTMSAGRGRTFAVHYVPLLLRHEVSFRGDVVCVFCGTQVMSEKEARRYVSEKIAEYKHQDRTRPRNL